MQTLGGRFVFPMGRWVLCWSCSFQNGMEQTKRNTLEATSSENYHLLYASVIPPILGRGWTFIDSLTPFTFLFIHSFNIYKSLTLGKAMFPPKAYLDLSCGSHWLFYWLPEAKTMPECRGMVCLFLLLCLVSKDPGHSLSGRACRDLFFFEALFWKLDRNNVQPYRHLIIFWIPR